jgi:hypothetical protein
MSGIRRHNGDRSIFTGGSGAIHRKINKIKYHPPGPQIKYTEVRKTDEG